VPTALAIATIAGIGGAALASVIGRSRTHAARLGHATAALAILLFAMNAGTAIYVAAICLLQIAWCFTAPFLLAICATSGRADAMMSATNLTLGAGLAVGPLMAGQLLETPGAFVSVSLGAGALLTTGVLFLRLAPREPPLSIRAGQGTGAS